MSSKYNLNELAGLDFFTFDLDGQVYKMSYPTSNELLGLNEAGKNLTKYQDRIDKLEKEPVTEATTKELKQLKVKADTANQSFLDWCAGYIKPEAPEAPDFKSTILSKNLKYMLAFADMIDKELNG